MATKKIQILSSVVKQADHANNADCLGGRSPSYFATASELDELQTLIGEGAVSAQIHAVINELTADDLGVYVQDEEPENAVDGDIWIEPGVPSNSYVPINHAHNDATATSSGFMSAADKAKLDSISDKVYLTSPNGTKYELSVSDDGVLSVTAFGS